MSRKTLLILSVISGLLLSLPWITTSFSWVLFFALVPLLVVEDQIALQKQNQQSIILFFYAFGTFFIWNLVSAWWIIYVSFTGMMIITGLNAILMACVWWLMHLLHRKFTARTGHFSLVVFWLTFEYLHFNWSFQWPWLTLGNGFANSVQMVQWYEFTGVLGGSLWILLANIGLFSVYKSFSRERHFKSFQVSAWLLLLIIIPVGWSLFRYFTYTEKGEAIEVVVLQPNINPYTEKFSGLSDEKQMQTLISLIVSTVSDSTDFVLAPETALPVLWEDSVQIPNRPAKSIFRILRQYSKASFIVGALTQKRYTEGESISKTARLSADNSFYYDVYNSALLFDTTSKVQIGHKSILVSGVEKMPFQEYFSFLGKYVINIGGSGGSLAAASQSTVFEGQDSVKIGSVICFESAFGEYIGSAVTKGANLIFVITNDGWWKDSPGVMQHFSYSRLRAVESRRSVARSANTGISGFIDERGNILKKTDVNTAVAIKAKIRMNNTITFYVRYGDYLGWLSMILSGLILVYLMMDRIRVRR